MPRRAIYVKTNRFRPKITGKIKRSSDDSWYGKDWSHIAKEIRKRDGYRCQYPGCTVYAPPPFTGILDVHHIVPLPRGTNDPDNLVTLCGPHHECIHGKRIHNISDKKKAVLLKLGCTAVM